MILILIYAKPQPNPKQKNTCFFFYEMLLTNKCELCIIVLVVKYPIGVGGDEKKCN